MDNAAVVKMVRAGLHDADIIGAIRESVALFQLAPEDLVELTASGVSGEVIRAMLDREFAFAEGLASVDDDAP